MTSLQDKTGASSSYLPTFFPTLKQTLLAQNDLEALCADRELRTSEIFHPNAYYGHDLILKSYAGLSLQRPLYGVVVHGVVLDPGFVWSEEIRFELPAVLSYPEYRHETYARATDKIVLASASPYLYMLRLLPERPPPARRGTIFFPSHSTHLRTVADAGHRVAAALDQIPEDRRPITVCIYWKDFLLDRHLPFVERGFQVVSAGHIYDPHFLFRLHHLCSIHEYASGEVVGSHVFASVSSGCRYTPIPGLPPAPHFEVNREDPGVRVPPSETYGRSPDLRRIFLAAHPGDRQEQRAAAAYYFAATNLLGPAELREQLLTLKRYDRRGYTLKGPEGLRFVLSPLLRRYARKARRLIRSSL